MPRQRSSAAARHDRHDEVANKRQATAHGGDERITKDHATGIQNSNRHIVSKNPGTLDTTPDIACSESVSSVNANPDRTTTTALVIASTTSVGRRDLGSSCADAKSWSPSGRLAFGGTADPGLVTRSGSVRATCS
jgi:hypothetical protein